MMFLMLAVWLGCTGPRPPGDVARQVVLVSMDTMRYDATGPFYEQLSERCVRFEAAMAPAPTTLASHVSMVTGLYPHRHGVPRNEYRVPERLLTLAEHLSAAGYETGAFLGAMPLGPHTGFTQGFDHVNDRFTSGRGGVSEQTERPGSAVTDAATTWLRQRTRPHFAFIHYYDAHQPYLSSVEGLGIGTMQDVLAARTQAPERRPDEELVRLYRADAASVDRELQRVLEAVEAGALLVVTADHGEALNQHPEERFDHGHRVFQETVHVPLLICGVGVGRVVDTPVSLVDLVPTMLAVLEQPVPAGLDGVNLGPLLDGGELDRGPVFSEATKPGAPPDDGWFNAPRPKAIRSGALKLHVDPVLGRRALYDLSKDPDELRPFEDVRAESLETRLRAWVGEAEPPKAERVSDVEAVERLRSLGYLD